MGDKYTLKTVTELAALLGITRQAVLERIKRGTVKAHKRGGMWWVRWSA